MNACFPKSEHLCSRKLIEHLYAEGRRLMAFPFSIQWAVEPALAVPCQVLIVAPKRKLHHAVDRNRMRRLTRECYRLNKHRLLDTLCQHDLRITLSFVYIHNELLTYNQLNHKFDKALTALMKDIVAYEKTLPSAAMAAE